MGKLSKQRIERLAVTAIIAETNKPYSYLISDIPMGDKGVSFDGKIEVFADDSEKIESLVGHVPVQVKGTQVKEFSQGKISFSLKLSHYRNFYKTNGVLLLVVEVKETGESKIFYKQLMPLELSSILREFGLFKKQKYRSTDLRPLEETSLHSVCSKFIIERDNQPKTLIENNPFTEDVFSKYELSSLTFNPDQYEMHEIFHHDFTMYGLVNDLKVPLSLGKVTELKQRFEQTFEIRGNAETFRIEMVNNEDGVTYIFEEVFQFSFNIDSKKINMNFLKFHSLAAQLKVVPLVIQLFESKRLEELGININRWHTTSGETSDVVRELNKKYAGYKKIQQMYRVLGLDENMVISSTNDEQDLYIQLLLLAKAILNNDLKGVSFKNPDHPCLVNFHIGDLMFILKYRPGTDNQLTNAFSNKILEHSCQLIMDGEEPTPYSIFFMLTEDALAKAKNIDHSIIRLSFDKIDPFYNDLAFQFTNKFCLDCINAYDHSFRKELLETAEYIFNKYEPTGTPASPSMNDAIIAVNLCQIRKRKTGQLSPIDLDTLLIMKTHFIKENEDQLIFCVNVLLESRVEAEIAFRKMTPDQQEEIKVLPIAKLFQDLTRMIH